MTHAIRSFEQLSLEMRDSIDSSWSERDLTAAEKQRLGTAGPDVGPYEFCPQTDSVANAMDLTVGNLIEWDERVTEIVSFDDSDATSSHSMHIRVIRDSKNDANLDTEPYGFDIWAIYTHWRRGNIRLDTDNEGTQ